MHQHHPPSSVRDAPASLFSPIGNEKTRELSPVFLKSHNHLHWLAHLQAATTCEPLRRKPRAIAISPAPNRSCYTAGIRHLLEPKRSATGGADLNRPTACAGWLTGLRKNPGTVPAFFHCRLASSLTCRTPLVAHRSCIAASQRCSPRQEMRYRAKARYRERT